MYTLFEVANGLIINHNIDEPVFLSPCKQRTLTLSLGRRRLKEVTYLCYYLFLAQDLSS